MRRLLLALVFVMPLLLTGAEHRTAGSWVPARWEGGPLELARRSGDKALADPALREAIAQWYDPTTLKLLEGSPINCVLVTFSGAAAPGILEQQQRLAKEYAGAAHGRGLVVLGLVYPGADPSTAAAAALDAGLDGLVPDGDFPDGFVEQLEKALGGGKSSGVVIPIYGKSAVARASKAAVVAVEGVSPGARNLADMGIRGAPSSEPWIESNIWLVRSLRRDPPSPPIWISQRPATGSSQEYARCVADAAVAGGRWIVALDDTLRAKLKNNDGAAMAAWQGIGTFLRFAEEHAEWRNTPPFGNVAVILDPAADPDISDEYLNLLARRQVPYHVIPRSSVATQTLARFRVVLAPDLSAPAAQERQVLHGFAEAGGVVVTGPSWGSPPKEEPYAELPLGKGRVVVYKDPDPESVARDMKDLLSQDELGIVPFNVPSVITYASTGRDGKCGLIQLLNYSNSPAVSITVRVSGSFTGAKLYTPESAPSDLKLRTTEGRTDISIPRLPSWGGLRLE